MIDIVEVKPIDNDMVEYYIKMHMNPETSAQAEKEIASLPDWQQSIILSSSRFRSATRRFHQANKDIDARFAQLRKDIDRKAQDAHEEIRRMCNQ